MLLLEKSKMTVFTSVAKLSFSFSFKIRFSNTFIAKFSFFNKNLIMKGIGSITLILQRHINSVNCSIKSGHLFKSKVGDIFSKIENIFVMNSLS